MFGACICHYFLNMQYMRLQIKINKINYIYRPNLLYTNPVVGKIPTRQNPDFRPTFPTWRRFHVIKDIAFLKPVNRAELLTD